MNMFHYVNGQLRQIKSPITEFNMDNFLVPSTNRLQLCRFRIKSAIIRIGETIDHGHYIIWTATMATIVTGLKYQMNPSINIKSLPTLKITFKYISPKNYKFLKQP